RAEQRQAYNFFNSFFHDSIFSPSIVNIFYYQPTHRPKREPSNLSHCLFSSSGAKRRSFLFMFSSF
ncbi:hypothetical protein L9F63_027460, partial [Diploptera punctata]